MRTRLEIDTEFTHYATLLGDRSFKVKFLQAEIQQIMEKMSQLNQEPAQIAGPMPPNAPMVPEVSLPAELNGKKKKR